MAAVAGGCWYPDLITNVMGGGAGVVRGWSGEAGATGGQLLRWDLRRVQRPVVEYCGHVNRSV